MKPKQIRETKQTEEIIRKFLIKYVNKLFTKFIIRIIIA